MDVILVIQKYLVNSLLIFHKNYKQKKTHTTGFEPVREDPNGFQVHRLNHSAKCANIYIYIYINF